MPSPLLKRLSNEDAFYRKEMSSMEERLRGIITLMIPPYLFHRYFRGSAIRPSIALATTVAGLARKILALAEPIRPL